jgi:hypothetical protein
LGTRFRDELPLGVQFLLQRGGVGGSVVLPGGRFGAQGLGALPRAVEFIREMRLPLGGLGFARRGHAVEFGHAALGLVHHALMLGGNGLDPRGERALLAVGRVAELLVCRGQARDLGFAVRALFLLLREAGDRSAQLGFEPAQPAPRGPSVPVRFGHALP